MSSGNFGTVNATGMNVTGVLQASQIITSQPMQVSNLTATGSIISSSNTNVLNVLVKDLQVAIDTGMMGDLLATTQSGRTKLAQALDYGYNKETFDTNGITPLLDAGYSGKGVCH